MPGTLPAVTTGVGFFAENLEFVADPANAGVVYVTGQGNNTIFRYDPVAGSWGLGINGGAFGTPHADPRDMVFLGNNTLLEADDGGFYFIQNPMAPAANGWNSFNGNLDAFELWGVASDSTNNVIIAGSQDNGSTYQNTLNGTTWTQFLGNDGQFQAVNTTSLPGGDVFRYSLANNFSQFERNRFTNANVALAPTNVLLRSSIAAANLSGLNAADAGFTGFAPMPFALNSVDPQLMMLGFNGLYEDADTTAANGFAGDVIANITPVGLGSGQFSAIAYGGFVAGAASPMWPLSVRTSDSFRSAARPALHSRTSPLRSVPGPPSTALRWIRRIGGASMSCRTTASFSLPTSLTLP